MRLYLTRPGSNIKAVALIDKKHIHNNRLQVINQYEETEGKHTHAMMCLFLSTVYPLSMWN